MKSTLKRAKNPMPAYVRQALTGHGLMEAYNARPPYQRNDYLGWIAGAKLEPTRRKRLAQMLTELKGGQEVHEHGLVRWAADPAGKAGNNSPNKQMETDA